MFEQDYIMRLIREFIRAIMRYMFHLDIEAPTMELVENQKEQDTLGKLIKMVDQGNICEAENKLYEVTENRSNDHLKMALVFYSYLNEQSADFLEQHNFSRKEVREGLEDLASAYGIKSLASSFFAEYEE